MARLRPGDAINRRRSIGATDYRLSILFYPCRQMLAGHRPLDRDTVTAELTTKNRRRIATLRTIADRSPVPLLSSIQGFVEVLDQFARGEATADTVHARAAAIDARMDELGSDPNFTDKEVRDGY